MSNDTPATSPQDNWAEFSHTFAAISDWVAELPSDDAPVVAALSFTGETPGEDGRPATCTVNLTERSLSAVRWLFERGRAEARASAKRRARIDAMAAIMVEVRRELPAVDIGHVISRALHLAAGRLLQPWYLIIGRPGSWEAALLMGFAVWGQHVDVPDDASGQVEQLADLFGQMGDAVNQGAPEDGGETLAEAIGLAATALGSMAAFVGDADLENDLRNIGGQYANVPDAWRS